MPSLPDSDWKIDYEAAFKRFIAKPSHLPNVDAVSDWIVACRLMGPPADGIAAGDDFYLSRIGNTPFSAEYLVIPSDCVIICKHFR